VFEAESSKIIFKESFKQEYLTKLSSGGTLSLTIRYKRNPLQLRRSYSSTIPIYEQSDSVDSRISPFEGASRSNNSPSGYDIQQRGSISRGIIVGSNQDFALESGLNFELSGQLTDNVSIEGVLTDRSIPIQPDGTTQNLKEFDRVFIQVNAPTTSIEMGDVDLALDQSYFAQIDRRLQGAALYNKSSKGDYSGAASVARGNYKRLSFSGLEGVQGPYRLTGDDNDEFVIVLAGTERVYIDGELVQRGETEEYIIDYGLGEIYFTSNQLIKEETRIVVEYEYVNQNFSSTLVAAEGLATSKDKRFTIGTTVIRQADNNNLLSQRVLSESDIEVLKSAGDNREDARVSGATTVSANDTDVNVFYIRKDTLYNGQIYTIYENTTDTDTNEDLYKVRFTKVGVGAGAYERIGSSVNGLLFEWVGPNNGSYSSSRILPSPIEQQMAAIKSGIQFNEHIRFNTEWAISDIDKNRFSSLDDGDNTDFGFIGDIKIDELPLYNGLARIEVASRITGSEFAYFDRVKDIEFERKWNAPITEDEKETLLESKIGFTSASKDSVSFSLGRLNKSGFQSLRQASNLDWLARKRIHLQYRQDWVQSRRDEVDLETSWIRQEGSAQFTGAGLIPGLRFEHEQRLDKNIQLDSLGSRSFQFIEVGPNIEYRSSTYSIGYGFEWRVQEEYNQDKDALEQHSMAHQHVVKVNVQGSDNFTTRNNFTYREKRFTDFGKQQGRANKTGLLMRSVTNYASTSDFIDGEFLYDTFTQQQALVQETYIEVGPEIGQYTWDDLNEDDIEQVDEFFPELTPNEGTYIRQLLPVDDLQQVISLRFRTRHVIKPLLWLGESSIWKDVELISRFDVRENSTTENLSDVYLLKLSTFREEETLNGVLSWEKYLRILPDYSPLDIDLRYNQLRSLSRRSSEVFEQFNDSWLLSTSYRISDQIEGGTLVALNTNKNLSSSLSNRNFNIREKKIEQSIESKINASWQTGFASSYTFKEDRKNDSQNVSARIVKIRNTHRFFLWRKLQANSSMEFRSILVDGSTNPLGIFELTEGAGKGESLLWALNASYRASNLVRFNFSYDGRTSANNNSIHIVKLVVNATF
jgi:hypothetical protein